MRFGFLYKNVCRPLLFLFDPELVHDTFILLGEFLGRYRVSRRIVKNLFYFEDKSLSQEIWGMKFKNPIGLAAGFDKDGRVNGIMESVGFGFSEVGTVTFKSYQGNPKPRLKRLPKSKGLLVYYGLKNIGADKISLNISKSASLIPKVVSIGRTNSAKTLSLDEGIKDYLNCLKVFEDGNFKGLYEINISCPNVFGRSDDFMVPDNLSLLLKKIFDLKTTNRVFIKMPINLPWEKFKILLDVIMLFPVSAVVIGNLNKNKDSAVLKDKLYSEARGGISGELTKKLSNELISKTRTYCGERLKIIGVGGIFSAEDAYEKIKRGASLVELITGMIYEGPQLVGEINKKLISFLKKDGFANISEAVGTLV